MRVRVALGRNRGRQLSTGGNATKTRQRLFVALAAALAVSLGIAAVGAMAAETPWKGTVSAVETGVTVFPSRSVTRDGTGTATYLGNFSEHVVMQINLLTLHGTGLATFTAANGDILAASVDGQATRTGPTQLATVEVYTIIGGTGRFADATGTFTLENALEQTTGVSSGTLSGVIDH